jgi:hypothetical protein
MQEECRLWRQIAKSGPSGAKCLKSLESTKQAPPPASAFLDMLDVAGKQVQAGSRNALTRQNTLLTRLGATRHRPPPLIGRVTGHGFQPTDETAPLQNLNVMTVDERFNLPDNIRVLFADEDKCVAGQMPLRIELINPIDGHDGGAPQRYTDVA